MPRLRSAIPILVTGGSDFRALNQLQIVMTGWGHFNALNQFHVGMTSRSNFTDLKNLHSVSPFSFPKTTYDHYLDALRRQNGERNSLRLEKLPANQHFYPGA